MTDAASVCLNCGTRLHGPHCAQCGQRAATARFTWHALVHDVPHAIFHVDRGIVPTIAGLLKRPGHTINAYLDGQRARYFNPLTLLALCAGVYVFLYNQPFVLETVRRLAPTETRSATEAALQLATRWYSLMLLLLVPLVAAINRWVYRNHDRNFAEHLVIIAFINVISTLMMIFPLYPLLLVVYALTRQAEGALLIGLWLAAALAGSSYQVIALHAVFKRENSSNWRGAIKANASNGLVIVTALLIGLAIGVVARGA